MSLKLIYVTCETRDEAVMIANTVVEDRLAACANILGDITSIYWWEGSIQEGREIAVILKTRSDLVDKLTERIKKLHSYSCPCVVALPIEGGNREFLDWVATNTKQNPNETQK